MKLIPASIHRRIKHRPNLVKIADNISWLFFDKILRMGIGLIVGVWIARYLGPEQFGLLNYALAFTVLFGGIATLGLQGIVVRDIVRDPGGVRLTLGAAALLQFIGGLIAFALVLVVIACLRPDDPLARSIVAILGATVLFRVGDISLYWFESQVQSKYIVWIQNSVFVVFSAVKVILILNKASIEIFVWAMLIEAGTVALTLLWVLNKFGLALTSLSVNIDRVAKLVKDSWPLAISGLAVSAYMKLDQLMLGEMVGDDAVGLFAAATRVSEAWYFIPMAFVASVTPALIRAKNDCEKKYINYTQNIYDALVLMSLMVAVPMTFLSGLVIEILYGKEYSDSAAVLTIYIWASVFVFLGVASSQNLLAENRQIISMQRTFFGLLANAGLNLLLIPRYGIVGAATATVISQAMAAFIFDLFQKDTQMMFKMKLRSLFLLNFIKCIAVKK